MPDEPGLGELSRKIEDFRRDVRDDFAQISAQLERYVLREVYEAREAALHDRLSRIEREQESNRSSARAAIYAAVGSVLASITAGIVLALVLKGGR